MQNLVALIFIFLTSISGYAQLSGDTWATAKQTKKANLVVTYTHAPKFAQKIDGQYKGLCFDIMRQFADFVKAKYGVDVNLQYKDLARPEDFDLFLTTVKNSKGGVVGLGDITITNERKSDYNFSPPYFANIAIMVTHETAPNLIDMDKISETFAGMSAVVQRGTIHETRINEIKSKYYPGLTIETTMGFNDANKKVADNPKYFTYFDFSTYLNVLEQKFPVKRQPVGDKKGDNFGFIMPKSNDWGPVFEEFFAQNGGYTRSTEYRKLMADNLGSYVLRLLDAMDK